MLPMPKQPPESHATPVVAFDERALLRRHVGGDREAFRTPVRKFSARVYGYLAKTGVPATDRDDLFQEIFLRVHRSASLYSPDRSLSPWVFTIVVNTTRSYFRKAGVRSIVSTEASLDETESQIVSAAKVAEAKETAGFMVAEVEKLSESQREALLLCAVEGLSQTEVAEILEIPVSTVKTNLRRARIALAAALGRRELQASREVGQ